MSMRLIAGTFRILGAEPDGDSIRFYPDDPNEWTRLGGIHQIRPNAKGGAHVGCKNSVGRSNAAICSGIVFVHPTGSGQSSWAALEVRTIGAGRGISPSPVRKPSRQLL
jgi:hypothetical protein